MIFKEYKLKDLGEIITGKTPSKSNPEYYNSKDVMFIKPDDLSQDNILLINNTKEYISKRGAETVRVLPKNSVLVTCIGIIGKVAILTNNEAAFNQQINAIIPNENIIKPKYLAYSIWFNRRKLQNIANAPVVPIINKTQFSEFKIQVPNLDYQMKVVSILDKANELIDKRKAQIEALDQLTQSVFLEMFGNPISNSKGWDLSICKDVTKKIGSGATPKGGNASYKDEGISLIRSMNVYNNRFSYKDLAFIDDEQAAKLNNVAVCKNDILLNITGASVARSCIVPDDVLPARVNQHVSIIRVKDDLVNPIFLSYLFTNEIYQKYLLQLSTTGGATREAITKQQIENLPIILPPLYIQEDFVYKVKQIEKQKSLMQASIEEFENLYSSLMQKAFQGELFPEEKVSNL